MSSLISGLGKGYGGERRRVGGTERTLRALQPGYKVNTLK